MTSAHWRWSMWCCRRLHSCGGPVENATNILFLLQADRQDSVILELLDGGESGRSGSDDCHSETLFCNGRGRFLVALHIFQANPWLWPLQARPRNCASCPKWLLGRTRPSSPWSLRRFFSFRPRDPVLPPSTSRGPRSRGLSEMG